MNIRRPWLKLALLFSIAAVIGFLVPTSLAYIVAQSDSLVNTFEAPYFQPTETSVDVRVQKTVINPGSERIGPEGFRFVLENTENGEMLTLISDANGAAAAALPFSAADAGRTYIYRLYEINDGRMNVSYSNVVYMITITVSVNADNQVTAAVSVNGAPVEQVVAAFENTYTAGLVIPDTGDDANLPLYGLLMLIGCAGMVILLTKRKEWSR